MFPLWLYRDGVGPLFAAVPASVERAPNFAAQFIAAVERRLERRLSPTADRSSATRFAPSDLFAYLYAVLNSPSFCRRYGNLLRGDFPRVPIAAGWARFRALARLGHALIRCHLMRGEFAGTARYPVAGNDQIARAEFDSSGGGRIWINDRQYFSPVPEDVWRQCLGGYRVAEHWLTDRASRQLAYDELSHFRALIGALGEAAKIAAQIDAAIPDWPLD